MAKVVRSSFAPRISLRAHRSLDERLFARWPAAWAALARLVLRLPPRSRLRRALIRRSALSGWAARSRGDLDLMLVRYAPDYQVEMPPEFAGVGIRTSYRGHAGLRELVADTEESFTEQEFAPLEVLDVGDRLVILGEIHFRSRSGVGLDSSYGQVFWFERGLIAREVDFTDWDETLRAAGIPTSAMGGNHPRASSISRWEVEPLYRSRRGLDERLLLAVPWLLRLVFSLCARARPGSRLRRVLIGHILRVGFGQVNRGDYEALFVGVSREVEVQALPDNPGARPVDIEPTYRGRDGYVRLIEMWKVGLDEFRIELRELVDPGGTRIGGQGERIGRGTRSGIEVRDTDFYVWQFERGMLRRQWVLASESAMLTRLREAGPPD